MNGIKISLKKIIAVLLAMTALISVFSYASINTQAASLTQTEFNNKIANVKKTYNLKQKYSWSVNSNVVGYQCHGYARWLSYTLWGTDFGLYNKNSNYNWYTATSSSDKLGSLKPGDFVRYNNGRYDHTICVTSISGSTIYFTDCNSDGKNTVKFGRSISLSSLRTKIRKKLNEGYAYGWIVSYKKNTLNSTFTVKYNANGGSGAPSSQTKKNDTTLKLSSTKPTRTGFTFLGWSTSSTATKATYSAGGTYTANSSATLYAVWSLNTSKSTKYKTPLKAYTIGAQKTLVYNINGNAKTNKIYSTDLCTIKSIYSNNWCQVTFPLDSGGTETGYVKLSVFFSSTGTSVTAKTTKAKITTYRRSNANTTLGYTGKGDKIYIVSGKVNSRYQIIYELTSGGYKLGWISATDYSKNLK